MARTPKSGNWSMKQDRELIELSKSSLTLEDIAERYGRKPSLILQTAAQPGLTFRRRGSTRLKANGTRVSGVSVLEVRIVVGRSSTLVSNQARCIQVAA